MNRAERMARSRTPGGLRRLTGAASCPWVRALAAAAVRCCAKASGRRVVRRVRRGRVAPLSTGALALPPLPCGRSRAVRRTALRALEDVLKVLTGTESHGCAVPLDALRIGFA